jgi:hypothetical protein
MLLLLSALLIWATITSISATTLFQLTEPGIDGSQLPLKEFESKVADCQHRLSLWIHSSIRSNRRDLSEIPQLRICGTRFPKL